MRGGAQPVVGGETGFGESDDLACHHRRLDEPGLVEHVLRSLQLMCEDVLGKATKRVRVRGSLHLVDEGALARRQRRELGSRLQCFTGVELRGCPSGLVVVVVDGSVVVVPGSVVVGSPGMVVSGVVSAGGVVSGGGERRVGRERGVGRQRRVGCRLGGGRRIGVVGERGQTGQRHEEHTQQREDADEGQRATCPTATLARPLETATVHRFSPSPEAPVSQVSGVACSESLQTFGHKGSEWNAARPGKEPGRAADGAGEGT